MLIVRGNLQSSREENLFMRFEKKWWFDRSLIQQIMKFFIADV